MLPTIDNKFLCFEDAYRNILWDIKNLGMESAPRGRKTKELLGYTFAITNPVDRLIGFKERNLNIFFAIGNFLWVMSQSNDVEFISYYNPKGLNFSEDGKTLPAAYGKRIFDIDGMNQYKKAIDELKIDPHSRRALIQIFMAKYDWRGYLDTSCTADFQLLIREGKLVMINHMRSQSALMVMPYDIFLMTMIQEYAAAELGVELGEYIHFCNSLHFFENENELADKCINTKYNTPQMTKMPKETNSLMLKQLLTFERELRKEAILNSFHNSDKIDFMHWLSKLFKLNLPTYWHEIGILLILKAMDYNEQFYSELAVKYLTGPYRSYIKL